MAYLQTLPDFIFKIGEPSLLGEANLLAELILSQRLAKPAQSLGEAKVWLKLAKLISRAN